MLNAAESTPLYIQLKQNLLEKITKKELKPHDKLPSEKDLCETYEVSRITVRQALGELMNEGLIYRVHGKGSFVAPAKVKQELTYVTPFEQTLRSKGITPSTKLLNFEFIPADYNISTTLAIPLSSSVAKLELLGLGNEKPMGHYLSYFKEPVGEKIYQATKEMLQKNIAFTTYDLYKNIDGVTPTTLTQSFEACTANKEAAELLNVDPGDPLLRVSTVIYSSQELPLEYRTAVYRGDKYSFSITRPFKY